MGLVVGEGVVATAELAILQDVPILIVAVTSGARLQEGILSLMQMAPTTGAVNKVKDKRLPLLVVLTDPTIGAAAVSCAILGDIVLVEPGKVVGLTQTCVVEQSCMRGYLRIYSGGKYLLAHGMLDIVAHRYHLSDALIRLLKFLRYLLPSGEVIDLLLRTEFPSLLDVPTATPASV